MRQRLKDWARGIKQDVMTLYIAGRDPRTPWAAKCLALFVVAYALSPIDLIPDFIPVLGLLDDLILVPLGILIAVRMIPDPLMQEYRTTAASTDLAASSKWGAWVVIGLWALLAVLIAHWLWPVLAHQT